MSCKEILQKVLAWQRHGYRLFFSNAGLANFVLRILTKKGNFMINKWQLYLDVKFVDILWHLGFPKFRERKGGQWPLWLLSRCHTDRDLNAAFPCFLSHGQQKLCVSYLFSSCLSRQQRPVAGRGTGTVNNNLGSTIRSHHVIKHRSLDFSLSKCKHTSHQSLSQLVISLLLWSGKDSSRQDGLFIFALCLAWKTAETAAALLAQQHITTWLWSARTCCSVLGQARARSTHSSTTHVKP